MKVIILGDGLLAKEIEKQTKWPVISRKKNDIDFDKEGSYLGLLKDYDVVLNCIANTDTYSKDKESMWKTNVKGLSRLVDYCHGESKKLVHISSDYVYANSSGEPSENDVPVHAENWYSYSKLVGDAYIELKAREYLIIRCSHKPNPFPYPKAYANIRGNFDYVDVISKQIVALIEKDAKGIYNVGTKSKTLWMLAQKTKQNIQPDMAPALMPKELNMNLNKLNNNE